MQRGRNELEGELLIFQNPLFLIIFRKLPGCFDVIFLLVPSAHY